MVRVPAHKACHKFAILDVAIRAAKSKTAPHTEQYKTLILLDKMVERKGIEPSTFALRTGNSWALKAF
jgi:hypothetical protein